MAADDPLANMPQIAPDSGNRLWAKAGEGIDAFMNMLIEETGNLVGAVVTKGPGLVMDAAANVSAKIGAGVSAAVPFKPDFSPSASMESPQSHNLEGHARARSQEVSVNSSYASLGDLTPPATPSMGVVQGQGMYRA